MHTQSFYPRFNRQFATAGLMLVCAGCPREVAVWIPPASTADSLRFVVGRKVGQPGISIDGFAVAHCNANIRDSLVFVWRLDSTSGDADIDTISFGHVPTGFRERAPAPLLRPGCYRAGPGGASAFFIVTSSRSVRPFEPKVRAERFLDIPGDTVE